MKRALVISAKSYVEELTIYNVMEKDLCSDTAIRKMLNERGVKPETLPAAEDVKKVLRRLEGEEKKVLRRAEK